MDRLPPFRGRVVGLRGALGALALLAVACSGGASTLEESAPTPESRRGITVLAGLDTSIRAVPLEEIHFDTFDGKSITLADITVERLVELRDRIPPLDAPVYQSVKDANAWLADEDLVTGFSARDESVAYPHRILNFHEIVNDVVADVPVLVSYCPLCRSSAVYDRRAGGSTLTFGNSSALYQNDLVMEDRETRSYWWQVRGTAIVGRSTGTSLRPLPAQVATWGEWRARFPGTRVLSRQTGHRRNYGNDPFHDYDRRVAAGRFSFPVTGAGKTDRRLAAEAMVLGVSVGEDSVAFRLTRDAAIEATISGRRVVVFARAQGPGGAAFTPRAGGRALTFTRSGAGYRDAQTGTRWSASGAAVSGPLRGARLEPVPSRTAFWYAWVSAFPKTRIAG